MIIFNQQAVAVVTLILHTYIGKIRAMYVVQVKTIFAMSFDVLVLTRKKSHVTMYYNIHQTPSVVQ